MKQLTRLRSDLFATAVCKALTDPEQFPLPASVAVSGFPFTNREAEPLIYAYAPWRQVAARPGRANGT
jgi:hypothetical protein